MKVFVVLNSVPDYSASSPSFHSVHATLWGAMKEYYPDLGFDAWRKWPSRLGEVWEGPDGFGMIKEVDLLG